MKNVLVLAGLMALGFVTSASAAAPVEGKDYTRINPAQPTIDPQKIVITEFFSYQCPHCYSFAKPLAAWVRTLPADLRFERTPVSFGRAQWEPVARAYLALKSMNQITRLDDAIFDAIHRQHLPLATEQAVVQWVGTQGIDSKAFASQYRSFTVETQLKASDMSTRALQIPSIPCIVIDGRYLVAIEDNGGFQGQLGVVNALIAKVRTERAAGK